MSSDPQPYVQEARAFSYTSKRSLLLMSVLILTLWNLASKPGTMTTTRWTMHDDPSIVNEADIILRRSYANSYAKLIPCDDDIDDELKLWNPSSWKSCMMKNLMHFDDIVASNKNITNSDADNTKSMMIPWWLQTLLRDVQKNGNGAYGPWHHFGTTTPPLNFCTIEKVATTEWRKIFCKINADDCVRDPKKCGKRKCAHMTLKDMPADAPWGVFLRDPLERLLSGFLNKCIDPRTRKKEGHCEPNVIFNPISNMKNEKGGIYPSLMEHLEGGDKQLLFAAYLDVLPLQWNLHFLPQAIACDLRRNIDKYAFVGNMGEDFMFDIERMANQFGGPLPELLNASFGYVEHVRTGKRNTGKDNSHHSTHAPGKVKQFYTASTVRRGLELMSIDYVLLGLKVPEWARQMLRDDMPRAISA